MPTTETRRLNPVMLWGIFLAIIAIGFIIVRSSTRDLVGVRVAVVDHQKHRQLRLNQRQGRTPLNSSLPTRPPQASSKRFTSMSVRKSKQASFSSRWMTLTPSPRSQPRTPQFTPPKQPSTTSAREARKTSASDSGRRSQPRRATTAAGRKRSRSTQGTSAKRSSLSKRGSLR